MEKPKKTCPDSCEDKCPKKNTGIIFDTLNKPEDLEDPKKRRELESKGVKPCKDCTKEVFGTREELELLNIPLQHKHLTTF